MRVRTGELIGDISGFLGISTTGKEILETLAKSDRGFLVSEIITRSKRSERAVRAHVKLLSQLHLIRRKEVITKRGKLAHRYLALRANELIRSTRQEMIRRLHKLEAQQKKMASASSI